MTRLSNNRDLFAGDPGETIIITTEAKKTPHQVTFADPESGGNWEILQKPTPQVPIERRQFTMPGGSREFFAIVYAFSPEGQRDPAAKYRVSFEGNGETMDGPSGVLPPFSGTILDLPCEFRLPDAPLSHFMTDGLIAAVEKTIPVPGLAAGGKKKSSTPGKGKKG